MRSENQLCRFPGGALLLFLQELLRFSSPLFSISIYNQEGFLLFSLARVSVCLVAFISSSALAQHPPILLDIEIHTGHPAQRFPFLYIK